MYKYKLMLTSATFLALLAVLVLAHPRITARPLNLGLIGAKQHNATAAAGGGAREGSVLAIRCSRCPALTRYAYICTLGMAAVRYSCTARMCLARLRASQNAAAQWRHAWSLRFSCTVRTCLVRLLAAVNVAAQWGHAWSLRFSCTVCTCVLRLQWGRPAWSFTMTEFKLLWRCASGGGGGAGEL